MSRAKKSPPGKVHFKVIVNTANLTEAEREAFPKLPGWTSVSGWASPETADKILRAIYEDAK